MVAHYNQSKQCDGIVCDICGVVMTKQFNYFSSKFDFVEVDTSIGKNGIKAIDRRYLDLDFCEKCMETLKDKVKAQIEKKNTHGSWEAKS